MGALAATRNLISIDEARRLVLDRVERLPAETARPRGRGRAGARRGRGHDRRPAAVRQLGDGRLRAAVVRHARTTARRPSDRRRRAGSALARGRRGDGHRNRRPWYRREPMPSSPSSMLSRMTTRSKSSSRSSGAQTCARPEETSAPARPSSRRARAWRRATSPRSPQRAFPRCGSPGGRGPPSS